MIFTPEDREKRVYEVEMAGAKEHGRAPDVRWHLRKDGSLIFVDGVVNALRSSDGDLIGFTKVMRDITPGRGVGGLIQTILEATDQRIFVKDRESRYAFANSTVARTFGRRVEDVIGKSDTELQPGELSERLQAHDRSVIDSGQTETVEETLLVDGRETTFLTTKAPWLSIEGSVVGVVGIAQDIGARKQAEAALRESEQRIRRTLEIETVGVIFFDLDGNIHHGNDAFLRMSGYTREDLPLRWDKLTAPEWMSVTLKTAQDLANTGSAAPYEKQYVRPDGSRWWGLFAPRMLNENEAVEFILDITQQKRAEAELQRSNEDLQQFAHVASHDLQTPLRKIKSYTQLLQRRYSGKLDATADDFIRTIVHGVETMEQLTEGLLHLAEVGKGSPERTSVRVEAVIDGVLADLQPVVEEAGAEVTCGALPVVAADPLQVLQLFQNLVGNALKYRHPERPPKIHISAKERLSDYLFSVDDNGIGIEERHWERIFAPLARLHTNDIPGTGIGLAVCRKIVERHGGRIWVESEPDVGSSFYFTLPR
jgi:PAS domain S-box-containing protein